MRWPAAPSYRTAEMSLSAGSMPAKEIFAGGSVRASTPEIPPGCTMHSPCRTKSLNEMLCVLVGCSQPHSSCYRPLCAPLASPVQCLTPWRSSGRRHLPGRSGQEEELPVSDRPIHRGAILSSRRPSFRPNHRIRTPIVHRITLLIS